MSPLATVLAAANRPAPTPAQATIQPTPVASIYAANDQQNMDAYKAQLAQQNSMFGGLASLGSAAIGAGGKYAAGSALGGAGAAAAGTVPGAIGATSLAGAPLVAGSGSSLAALLPFLFA